MKMKIMEMKINTKMKMRIMKMKMNVNMMMKQWIKRKKQNNKKLK